MKPLIRFLSLGDRRTDRRMKNFVSYFQGIGYEIELFSATFPDESYPVLPGVTLQEVTLSISSGPGMFLQYDKLLRKAIKSAGTSDIIFACDLFSLKTAAYAKILGKTKRVFYDARELYTELPAVANNPLKKWYWKRWEKRGLKNTDLVIITAPDDAIAIRNVHGFLPPSVVIRNLPISEELKQNNYLREKFSIPSTTKIFVYAGGVAPERGLRQMIEAIRLIDNAVLVIIGEGKSKSELMEKAKQLPDSIFFHPAIKSEQLIGILSSADVGVSLIEQHSKSYQLALPSKIFEYMLAGLPVVSSYLKQVKDLFPHHEAIYYADPDNRQEVLNACHDAMQLSGNPNLRQKIHDEMATNYTFEKDARDLISFLPDTRYPTPGTRP